MADHRRNVQIFKIIKVIKLHKSYLVLEIGTYMYVHIETVEPEPEMIGYTHIHTYTQIHIYIHIQQTN